MQGKGVTACLAAWVLLIPLQRHMTCVKGWSIQRHMTCVKGQRQGLPEALVRIAYCQGHSLIGGSQEGCPCQWTPALCRAAAVG
jgi:hypothetical protein